MLQDAHKALEAMSAASAAIKEERWHDAQQALQQVQQILTPLMRGVGDKAQEAVMAPKEDKGDRE
jgi:flagellin-specific chaperone FliS